ncbi:Uncharacterised protein [uncultured archaeon]|nr:Uncharacterised protein [uncultured archaeon]
MRMGKTAPTKIMKPAAALLSPNQIMAKGIHARGGMGRRISTMGSKILSAALNQPMLMPTGRATRSPAIIPMEKCRRLVGRSSKSMDCQMPENAATTWRKLGSSRVSLTAIAASCQMTIMPIIDRASIPRPLMRSPAFLAITNFLIHAFSI